MTINRDGSEDGLAPAAPLGAPSFLPPVRIEVESMQLNDLERRILAAIASFHGGRALPAELAARPEFGESERAIAECVTASEYLDFDATGAILAV